MCEFLTEGHFGRHIRRMRELYSGRLEVLRDAAHEKLSGLVELPKAEAGIQTVLWLAHGLNAESVAQAAAARNVETIPIERFVLKTPRPEGLLLGFAAYDVRQIREGVDRLAAVIDPRKPRG